jgi:Domain of unknown function (DUF4062)
VAVLVDSTAAARRADPGGREWLGEQRVFMSSAMGDTAAERRAVADVIEEMGARAVWFEEFGRDADAEEAYLTEVDTSTIYIGILNELYGRPNPPDGDSATEMEYRRARDGGKRVNVYVAANAPRREGALSRFIERVRFFVTSEDYSDAEDLARRVQRRLEELASEALSPWIKLGDFVFRADEVVDAGDTITIRARVSEDIAHQLEALRDRRHGRERLRFVSRSRVADGVAAGVRRTTRAGGAEELTIELSNVQPPQGDGMRAGTGGYSPDELVELGVRALFLGEPIPAQMGMLGFMTDTGIGIDDLRQAFDLSNEFAEAVVRLVVSDGLIGSGNARRVVSLSLGPRTGQTRRLELEWEDPQTYVNVEPVRRRVEGEWQRP